MLWPLVVYAAVVVILVAAILLVSHYLGERTRKGAAGEPYESGVVPIGYARFRISAQFYLIAMFFVIFDLEAVFIFAWAIAFREVGWPGYIEVVIFIAILLAALVYLWASGGLEWGPRNRALRRPARR